MSASWREGRGSLLWAAVFFSVISVAGAHEAGHGKAVEGMGPYGGTLAAVISAKDAELGPKAKTIALAEWKRKGNSLELTLLDLKKRPRAIKLTGQIKWILLKAGDAKPEVLLSRDLHHEFTSLEGVKAVEVILPAGYFVSEKAVAAFALK